MINFTYEGKQHSRATLQKLRQSARWALKNSGGFSSATGVTLQYGVEWCRENKRAFVVSVFVDKDTGEEMYHISLDGGVRIIP